MGKTSFKQNPSNLRARFGPKIWLEQNFNVFERLSEKFRFQLLLKHRKLWPMLPGLQ
jgi:hypothetical protein